MTTPTDPRRLRAQNLDIPFQIVLVEPEIPPNTGTIGRLCVATGSALHLVHPLGFQIDAHAVRRAGLDYWHLVDLTSHDSLSAALPVVAARGANRCWYLTGKAPTSYHAVSYQPGDAFIFGKESTGLSDEIVAANIDSCVAIPTFGAVRSLNLANAVSIVLYEALRQNGALDAARLN